MQKAHSNINWENLPSKNTPLGAYLLNKQDREIDVIDDRVLALYGYQDRVAQSEKNAKASETNAKTSETNAKQSELLAKEYAEHAFSGTPEGYDSLVDTVYKMDIKETTDTTLPNSKAGGYKLLSMSGNSVQNGTPTPNAPQSIHNVGDCVEMMQGLYSASNGAFSSGSHWVCNKNPIPCASGDVISLAFENIFEIVYVLYYNNGAFVSAVDIASTGKATVPSGVTHFNFEVRKQDVTVDTVGKISLTINGKYVVQIATNYGVEMMQGGWNATAGHLPNIATCVCNKTQVSCKTGDVVNIKCAKASGINLLLYNENTFVSTLPMSTSGVTIPSGVTNFKFNINSTSDITPDTVGKITITINGVGEKVATVLLNEPLREDDVMSRTEVVRKRASVIFDGSTDEKWQYQTLQNNSCFIIPLSKFNYVSDTELNYLCTHYSAITVAQRYIDKTIFINNGSNVFITDNSFTTLADFKTWLASNPITVEYELATPTIETLDTDSQIALNSLVTFDTVTYINVDSRVQPSEIKGEYGTSMVGARTIKNELKNDTLEIKYNELAVALVATESGV